MFHNLATWCKVFNFTVPANSSIQIIWLWQPNWLKVDFLAISQPSPIGTYVVSLECSTQGLSNSVGPIQISSAVQNAQAWHQIAFPKHSFLHIFSTNHPILFLQWGFFFCLSVAIQPCVGHSTQMQTQRVNGQLVILFVLLVENQQQQILTRMIHRWRGLIEGFPTVYVTCRCA